MTKTVTPRPKHKPQRTCIVCRETKDKRDLIRVVRTPEGEFMLDPTGKANGRGAYLCRQAICWEKGLQKQRLAHALKATPTTEQLTALQTQLQQLEPYKSVIFIQEIS